MNSPSQSTSEQRNCGCGDPRRQPRRFAVVVPVPPDVQCARQFHPMLARPFAQATVGRIRHRIFHHGCVDDVFSKLLAMTALPRRAASTLSVGNYSTPSSPIRWRRRVIDEGSIGGSCRKQVSSRKCCPYGFSPRLPIRSSSGQANLCCGQGKPAINRSELAGRPFREGKNSAQRLSKTELSIKSANFTSGCLRLSISDGKHFRKFFLVYGGIDVFQVFHENNIVPRNWVRYSRGRHAYSVDIENPSLFSIKTRNVKPEISRESHHLSPTITRGNVENQLIK